MHVSDQGITVLKYFEGCRLTAYLDTVAKPPVLTIGRGHTGPDVVPGMTITESRADELLAADLVRFELEVAAVVPATVTQGQFDAVVLWAYNCKGWRTATLLRRLQAGDIYGTANEFRRWNMAGGVVVLGLQRRREAERALFLGANARQALNIARLSYFEGAPA